METKKNIIFKVISAILSLAVTIICILVYHNRLMRFVNIPITFISIILLFAMFAIVLYSYIYVILDKLSKKKIVIPILLILVLVASVIGIAFIKDNVNYILRNIILMLVFIIGVVCLPIIVLGFILIGNIKNKKILICIIMIVTIYTYFVNFSQVMNYAEKIVENFASYSMEELFTLRQEEKVDRTYLENYNQKLKRNGYLDRFDITEILTIADSKSALTYINYIDETEDTKISITNKQDDKVKTLKESLESNFYKFNYEVNGNETTINIERYVVEENKYTERNEDIILSGTKNKEIIENIKKINDKEYFYIENKVNTGYLSDKLLNSLKILFVYDEETENFIPVVDDIKEYSAINNYSINNNYLTITLKEGVTLKNKDYTLRVNRYNNSNLNISNDRMLYYYDYEPVVTNSESSEGINLQISLGSNYNIETLKNIEVIFGE